MKGEDRNSVRAALRALPWLAPVLTLIFLIVLFPAGYMIWTSTRDLSQYGVDRGPAGLDNYRALLSFDAMPRVLTNTAIWVIGVVGLTLLISMGIAQFLSKEFPGRTLVRISLIIPWAASVVMTSVIFVYGLDPFYGVMNRMLVDVGILDAPFGFTRNPVPAFIASMVIAIFVSLPFTTYAILSGLQTIPGDVIEAALVDGATPWQVYRQVVLPLLRPAIAVATIINVINVFNSLPILQVMTGSLPGYDADTTTTLIFKFIRAELAVDTASALSVLNFVFILLIIGLYLVILKPLRQVEES
ncbi:MAG: sugar ABC transporter permease [Ilumatobacter coccineus]|uniref:Sugar ABC transporter permease n=1 Tax=Ilumatobacter coccineus TaxID=467094 RepID=A0A2G6KBN3_9ACTN|nr:MAG: sugar ABC transporter permease [Ilumatobacter coccineus]